MKSGRKRVGITTYWDTPVNYGQVLQGYALMSVLKKLGYEPFIVRYTMQEVYVNKSIFQRIRDFIRYGMNFSKFFKRFYAVREGQVNRHFDEFKHKYMCFSNRIYPSFDSLQKNYQEAEVYITGSDQVWGEWGTANKKKTFLLDFLPPTVTRVAYAASFGRNILGKDEEIIFKEALNKFQAISVREKSGVDLCKQLGGDLDVKWVVDPTLLLNKSEWLEVAYYKPRKAAYILCYLMQSKKNDTEALKFAKKIAKERNLKLVKICRGLTSILWGETLYVPTVEEWLGLYANASYIVTNSFHGVAFSVNFNKNFTAFVEGDIKSGRNSRLNNICTALDLSDRIKIVGEDMNIDISDINYSKVNVKLNELRKESIQYLVDSLNIQKK